METIEAQVCKKAFKKWMRDNDHDQNTDKIAFGG
jgi:hypothetical protein